MMQEIETSVKLSTVFALAYEQAKKNVKAHEKFVRLNPENELGRSQLEKARAILDEIVRVNKTFSKR